MNIVKQLGNSSIRLPAIGQGMGEYQWDDGQIEVLRAGIDLGMTFIDTAEGYDNGRSEEIIGKAISGIREKVIIGTKFAPEHNSYDGVLKAAEGSLRRLRTDYIDLYQIHWPNPSIPLYDTVAAMEKLVSQGKVKYVGVSNLSLAELREAQSALNKDAIASLQVEFNLFDRSIEDSVLPFCSSRGITVIAYSPLDQGRIADGMARRTLLEKLAKKYNRTQSQIALRWLVSKPSVIAIPKAKSIKHLKENAAAADFDIDEKDIEEIGNVFQRPIVRVLPSRIRVSAQGQGNKSVYQTIEEARENRLGHTPSPVDLAKRLSTEDALKPVRLIRNTDGDARYDYQLVEGRIRYWAWAIANNNAPIPAYVREDWS